MSVWAKCSAFLLAFVASCLPANLFADTRTETLKLTAFDGAAGDQYGTATAVSDSHLLVGAYRDSPAGPDSGSVYVYDPSTGGYSYKIVPDDAAARDQFGLDVAVDGALAVIGAPENDQFGGDSAGAAYVYDLASGTQLRKLVPSDGALLDRFGFSVAISQNRALVGSFRDDDRGGDTGSAYLFDLSDGSQQFKLSDPVGSSNDRFGYDVALDGALALVGAYGREGGGAALLFDATTGQMLRELVPDDLTSGDSFGWSVAIEGNLAVVSSPNDDDDGESSGSVYLFDATTGNQLAKYVADDAQAGEWFGYSVAIDDSTLMVGAFRGMENGLQTGSAYLFDVGSGSQFAELLASDGIAGDNFGRSVAIHGGIGLSGAPFSNPLGGSSGSAYLFDARIPEPHAAILLLTAMIATFWRQLVARRGSWVQSGN